MNGIRGFDAVNYVVTLPRSEDPSILRKEALGKIPTVVTLPRSEDPSICTDYNLEGNVLVVTLPRSEDPSIASEHIKALSLSRNSSKIGRPFNKVKEFTDEGGKVVTLPRSEDPSMMILLEKVFDK